MEDFRAPQSFNVEIGPEGREVALHGGVAGPSLPFVPQEITPEPSLYPQPGRGVRQGVIR